MYTFLVGVVSSVFLMTGCSASYTTISSSSEKDLAALYDATRGERVILYYRDTLTPTVISVPADDLIVTTHAASWSHGKDGLVSIKTSQIVKITCVSCDSHTATGAVIGGVLGTGTGMLFGLLLDFGNSTSSFVSTLDGGSYRSPESAIPASAIIGGLLGVIIGGSAGSNASQDEIWNFESPLLNTQRVEGQSE